MAPTIATTKPARMTSYTDFQCRNGRTGNSSGRTKTARSSPASICQSTR